MSLFLKMLGLAPSDKDEKLRELVAQSYKSVQVVGRGTITIDPSEVSQSQEFKNARAEAREIVARH